MCRIVPLFVNLTLFLRCFHYIDLPPLLSTVPWLDVVCVQIGGGTCCGCRGEWDHHISIGLLSVILCGAGKGGLGLGF